MSSDEDPADKRLKRKAIHSTIVAVALFVAAVIIRIVPVVLGDPRPASVEIAKKLAIVVAAGAQLFLLFPALFVIGHAILSFIEHAEKAGKVVSELVGKQPERGGKEVDGEAGEQPGRAEKIGGIAGIVVVYLALVGVLVGMSLWMIHSQLPHGALFGSIMLAMVVLLPILSTADILAHAAVSNE